MAVVIVTVINVNMLYLKEFPILLLETFGGIKSISENFKEPNKGISVILINTDKGKIFFENSKENFIFEKREVLEAIEGNERLRIPVKIKKQYKIFRKCYPQYGYLKTVKKMRTFKEILKDNKIIYKIYKMIK